MAHVSIYLNFMGNTAEAFEFYKGVFGTEYQMGPMRIGDMPPHPDSPPLSDKEKNSIMHVSLPILDGTLLMGTDIPESMGHQLIEGNNVTINLILDSNDEADKYYGALAEGGSQTAPMKQEFWGYWGTAKDKFGIRWMFNVMVPQGQ